MAEPKHKLVISNLDEISFVPDGDNPGAKIKLCKGKPNNSTEGATMAEDNLEDTYVSKEAFNQLQKRLAEVEEREAVAKINAESDALIRKICGPVKDVDLPGTLREIDRKCSPETSQNVRKLLFVLGERIQKGGLSKVGTTVPGGMSATEQFDQVIAEISKANPKLSKNDALIQAAGQRPDLYEAAKRGE